MPAPLPEEELMRRLGDLDAAAVIKLGRHFAKAGASRYWAEITAA